MAGSDFLNNGKNAENTYFKILLKKAYLILRKYYIILLILAVMLSVGWYKFSPSLITPKYTAKAILKLNLPENRQERATLEMMVANLLGLAKTRNFLSKVVDSLRYQLYFEEQSREELLDYFDYSDKSLPGIYKIIYSPDEGVKVFWTNLREKIKDRIVLKELQVSDQDTLVFNFIKIKLKPEILQTEKRVSAALRFTGKLSAINRLRENFITSFSQRNQFIRIEYSDKDRYLARDGANILAKLIIDENLNVKTLKIQSSIRNLEQQLSYVEKRLKDIEASIKDFRSKNPFVMLPGQANQEISQLTELEQTIQNSRLQIQILSGLREKLSENNPFSNRIAAMQEYLSLQSGSSFRGNSNLAMRFTDRLNQYNNLIFQYPESNPEVQNLKSQLNSLMAEGLQLINSSINQEENRISQLENQIKQYNNQLRRLPAAELELARLTREKEIVEQAYIQTKERLNEQKVAAASESPDIFLIDEAILPQQSVTNQFASLIQFGGVVGIIILFLFFFPLGLALLNKKIYFKEELSNFIKAPFIIPIPVIGKIEKIPEKLDEASKRKIDPKLITLNYTPNFENEIFRKTRSSIINELHHFENGKVLLGLSYYSGEGKSLIMSNLAVTFAQGKLNTLLIDADLRRGVQHNTFVVSKSPGLSNLLSPISKLTEENLNLCIQKAPVPNLSILTMGDPIPNPSELLGSERMKELLKLLQKKYDVILIDSAPFSITSDPLNLIPIVDKTLLIVMAGKSKLYQLEEMINTINNIKKDSVIGILLNGVNVSLTEDSYSYSYYNY